MTNAKNRDGCYRLKIRAVSVFELGKIVGWLGSSLRAPSERSFWGLRSEDSASTPATPAVAGTTERILTRPRTARGAAKAYG